MIFPNPFHDRATVQLTGGTSIADGEFKAYDIYGKMLILKHIQNSDNIHLERKDLPAGVYFYSLEDHHKILFRGKFMIK